MPQRIFFVKKTAHRRPSRMWRSRQSASASGAGTSPAVQSCALREMPHVVLMHLLICGQGYLGAAIAAAAAQRGWTSTATSLSGNASTLSCDLGRRDDVAALANRIARPDAIVHCASSGRGGSEAYEHVYVRGVQHLAEMFPRVPLLYTSSSSVYHQCDGSRVDETSPTLPDRETGKLLLRAEQLCLQAAGIVCRLSGIYGPQRSVLIKQFLLGNAVIEEQGQRWINQIHRDDAAHGILHLLTRAASTRSAVWNLTDSLPCSQLELYQGLARHFHRDLPPSGPRDLNRKRGWTHKQVSNEKLRQSGWQPRYPSFLDALPDIAGTIALDEPTQADT